eukprot:scaffold59206_cov53-Attheya_sp.AAC.3
MRRRLAELRLAEFTSQDEEVHYRDILGDKEKRAIMDAVLSIIIYQIDESLLAGESPEKQHVSSISASTIEKKEVIDGMTKIAFSEEERHNRPAPIKLAKDENVQQSHESPIYAQTTCSICLDEYGHEDSICGRPDKCTHIFHKDCIMSWLERQEVCPICRAPILSETEWRETAESLGFVEAQQSR